MISPVRGQSPDWGCWVCEPWYCNSPCSTMGLSRGLGSPVLFMSVAGIVTNVIAMIFSPVSVLAVMVGFSPNGGGSNLTTLDS